MSHTSEPPGTALANRPSMAFGPVPIMTDNEIERTWRIAKALAASRVFKDVTQAEQAFAKILLGRDLGLSPAQSMNAMDFVKGNVMLRAVTLASFVRRHPSYDYRIQEHTNEVCRIEFYEFAQVGAWTVTYNSNASTSGTTAPTSTRREVIGTSEFTIDDAKAAKLVRADSAWTSHPRNMLFARAMSNGVKWFCPEVVGGVPIYTEGDSFDDRTVLGTADEEPTPSDRTLPDVVESVLVRATELGHDGLSDRATAEMSVLGQSDAFVDDWAKRANTELDATQVAAMRARAQLLLDQATVLREKNEKDGADDLDDEAARLTAEADEMERE